MRSYPLCGFLLEIRKVANTMTNNPRILRHTAMGATLPFLSRKHSSSERKRKSENVTAEHHTPKLYICIPVKLANTSQKFSKPCFVFSFFFLYTYYIVYILYLLHCIYYTFYLWWDLSQENHPCPFCSSSVLPWRVALLPHICRNCFTTQHTHSRSFLPKSRWEHHNTKCQPENKEQDILHGQKLLLCDIWLLLPSEEDQARDRSP